MGIRIYHPATGRFLTTDPVPGGNATPYDYYTGDPVNCRDLDGNWSWRAVAKVVAMVAEVASIIPGPIGAVAGLVGAGCYAALGDYAGAAIMGVTAAAALVGAGGAVKIIAKAAQAGTKIAKPAGKALSHGNSLKSTRPTTLYALADRNTGEIVKYGITSRVNPRARYTRALYGGENVKMVTLKRYVVTKGGLTPRMRAKAAETRLITRSGGRLNRELFSSYRVNREKMGITS